MKAEQDIHGFLRKLTEFSNEFECSTFELLMGAHYLSDIDMRRIILLAASQ